MAGATPLSSAMQGGAVQQNAGPRPQVMSPQQFARLPGVNRMPLATTGTQYAPANILGSLQGGAQQAPGQATPTNQATAQHSTMGTSTAQGGNAGAAGGGSTSTTGNPLQPAYVNPNQFGPGQTLKQIMAGFMPQARMAQSDLNSQLAAAGIVGGGATGATQALQGQLTSSLAPTLANAIQTSQGMQLGAEQGNQQATDASRSQLANYLMQAWQIPYEAQAGLAQSALGGYSGLAGENANNFAVPPQSNLLNLWGLL
jgi:hypothetical protein